MGTNQEDVAAEIEVTLLDHPDAQTYFDAAFGMLDFNNLFQWPAISYYNTICKLYYNEIM